MIVTDAAQAMDAGKERLTNLIRVAANAAGVDFRYLMTQAHIESGLDPSARSGSSSATGLFQFTRDTWLKMIEQHGSDLGLDSQASALKSGNATASDRQTMLELRKDPEISSKLAAQYAVDNARALEAQGFGKPGPTELYLAHFLGSSGAAKFLSAMHADPNAPAADALPQAAAANKPVFYENGAPVSLKDLYQHFAKRFDGKSPVSSHALETARTTLSRSAPGKVVAALDTLKARLSTTTAPGSTVSKAYGTRPATAKFGPPSGKITSAALGSSHAAIGAASPESTAPTADAPPISVDSLARFLDGASKWTTDPGLQNGTGQKSMTNREATDGARS